MGGPTLIPLTVTVGGSYRKIANFLFRTRGLVTVRGGTIHARGRLFDVQSVALTESVTERFPKLDATIALNAYVYDGPIAPVEVPELPRGGGAVVDGRDVGGRERRLMATKANAQAARERKQKIFVAVGGLLLVGILAIQLPKLLGGSETTAAADTEATTTVAGEPATEPVLAATRPVALRDTDRRLAPGPGQLRSFSVFTRKDPFVQQAGSQPSESAGSGTASDG